MKGEKMKKIVFGLIGCFFLALPAICLGATGWYGAIGVGAVWVVDSDVTINGSFDATSEYDAGYAVGGALGYMIDAFRYEGEISYMKSDENTYDGLPTNADMETLTFLVNGYLDFDTGGPMTPYITVGIGVSKLDFNDPDFYDVDDTVFAYQVGAGVGFSVSETLTLDCKYRYMSGQDAEFSYPGFEAEVEIASHNLIIGLRMAF
jgi:opacity protein-like surface antigen